MSSSRRKKNKEPAAPPPIHWGAMSLIAIFLCRFLVPTEATEQGLTLWLCAATFGLATVVFAIRCRNQSPISFRPALPDLAITAMVCGHLLSGILIFTGGGNRRSALNIIWEWLAIGVFWVLLRVLMNRKELRQLLTQALTITVLGLSLLGIWQHYSWYPQQAKSFERLLQLNDQMAANESISHDERTEHKSLIGQFGTDILTLDRPGRMSYLARVKASVEPIGLFVLANTFALFLMVGFLFVVFDLFTHSSQVNTNVKVGLGVVGTLLLFCLILTKSRTAWVGTLTGAGMLGLLYSIKSRTSLKVSRKYLIIAATILSGLILWTLATGGLDPEVISEAPKSLQYRLEYWSATIELLKDRPVFGAGPGNFRQHYLRYKLPGSSEEILDPHNLFFGIWSGGGLLALIGLCLLIFCGITKGFQQCQLSIETKPPPALPVLTGLQGLLPLLLSYGLTITALFLLEGRFDQRLFVLGGITVGLFAFLHGLGVNLATTHAALLAALIAVLVHLLGASGIEMPAVVMLLIVLLYFICFNGQSSKPSGRSVELSERSVLVATLVSLGLLVGSLFTGLVPVQLAQTDMNIGKSFLLVNGNPQLAKRYFQSAIEADSLSPEPQQQLALLHFHNWQASGMRDQHEFDSATKHMKLAIKLDPYAAGRYRTLGNFWDRKAELTDKQEDALFAVEAYQAAVSLYPNFAALQAEFAIALQRANEPAEDAAKFALELDHLNQTNGHTDKYLADEARQRLEEILH